MLRKHVATARGRELHIAIGVLESALHQINWAYKAGDISPTQLERIIAERNLNRSIYMFDKLEKGMAFDHTELPRRKRGL